MVGANPVMDQLIGKTLGSCQILECIGRGGMAAVYRARQPRLNRDVAVKVIAVEMVDRPGFKERFEREARAIGRLDHPNILPIYEYGEQDGIAYLVMPLVKGGTLKDLLAKGPLSLYEADHYLSQAAAALQYAHDNGVIHRDVKPANMLLRSEGRLELSDFGIAKVIEETTQLGRSSETGGVGTPDYMAPEQVRGQVDPRSDIYALGILLYQILSGKAPFSGPTPMAVLLQHVSNPLPPLHEVNPAIPASIDLILAKATAKNPVERYQRPLEFSNAFHLAVQNLTSTLPGSAPGRYEGELSQQSSPTVDPARTITPASFDRPTSLNQVQTYPAQELPAGVSSGSGSGPPGFLPPIPGYGTGAPPPFPGYPPAGYSGGYSPYAGTPAPQSQRSSNLVLLVVALLLGGVLLVGIGVLLYRVLQPPGEVVLATPTTSTTPTQNRSLLTPTASRSPTARPTSTLTAVSTPTPAGPSKLQQQVTTILNTLPLNATASFTNLNGPERANVRGNTQVVSGAIIRLAIMVEVEKEVAAGKLSWDQTFTITADEVVGGTGILQKQVGRTLTLKELLETVIRYGDNTGGNILLDTIGMDTINNSMKDLGFAQIRFERKFLDQQARNAGRENRVSAGDLARMLQLIAQGKLISPAASADMLRILRTRGETIPGFLVQRLDPVPVYAHISGFLPDTGVFTDAALFYPSNAPSYILVICTRDENSEQEATDLMSTASQQVYNAVLGRS